MKQLLAVVGCHRSGTSVTAGVLHHLGVDFGPNLMPPSPANPSGYFESLRVVDVHDVLLRSMDRAWDDPRPLPKGWQFSVHAGIACQRLVRHLRRFPGRVLGVKDPRMCQLLPLWVKVAAELGARLVPVMVTRRTGATIASLARREAWPLGRAEALVREHLQGWWEWRTAHPDAVVVKYEELLEDWAAGIAGLDDAVGGLPWILEPDAQDNVDEFIDRGLQHRA